MQKQHQLQHLIQHAHQLNSIKYLFAIQYLEPDILVDDLTETDLKKLNKLSFKSMSIEYVYSLGKIYTMFLESMDLKKIDKDLLLEAQNILYNICSRLKGTYVSHNLSLLIQEISRIFLKLDDLQEDTRAKIEEIHTSNKPFLRNHNTFHEFEDYHKIETIRLHF